MVEEEVEEEAEEELRPEPLQAAEPLQAGQTRPETEPKQGQVGVPGVHATQITPPAMPVESIGNLEREPGIVPIATTVPGETLRAPGHAITETSSLKCPK